MKAEIFDELADRTRESSGNEFADEWRSHFDKSTSALREWICSQTIDSNAVLFEVYESLAEHEMAYGDFLLEEFERLLKLLLADPKNEFLYQTLESFTFLSGGRNSSKLLKLISSHLESSSSHIRRYSTHLTADFVQANDLDILRRIITLAENDEDWRVRVCAQTSLLELYEERRGFPEPPQLRFFDRLRLKIYGENVNYRFHD